MHNMLITLSLIAMVGAAVLSFMNKDNLATAKEDQVAKEKSLLVAQKELSDSKETLADLQQQLAETKSEGEALAAEAATLAEEIDAKDNELEMLESELTAAKDERDAQKEKLIKVGDLEAAGERLSNLQSENATLESRLTSLTNTVESATQQSENLQAEIDSISQQIADSESGRVPETFSASIVQVFPEWGFVIIGAGNQQRAAEGATLSVRRGGAEVAQVKITDVLQNRSIADVVRGTVASGVTLSPGDRVFPTDQEQ